MGSGKTWEDVIVSIAKTLERIAAFESSRNAQNCRDDLARAEQKLKRVLDIAEGIKHLKENGPWTPDKVEALLAVEAVL